jgi:hypothetical protein
VCRSDRIHVGGNGGRPAGSHPVLCRPRHTTSIGARRIAASSRRFETTHSRPILHFPRTDKPPKLKWNEIAQCARRGEAGQARMHPPPKGWLMVQQQGNVVHFGQFLAQFFVELQARSRRFETMNSWPNAMRTPLFASASACYNFREGH